MRRAKSGQLNIYWVKVNNFMDTKRNRKDKLESKKKKKHKTKPQSSRLNSTKDINAHTRTQRWVEARINETLCTKLKRLQQVAKKVKRNKHEITYNNVTNLNRRDNRRIIL